MTQSDISADFLHAYDELSDPLFRHCYFRVYDREKAKDLVQDTFMRAWNYIREGKEVNNLKAFLYTVANNLIIDAARKKKEFSLELLQEQGFQPSDEHQEHALRAVEAKYSLRLLSCLDDRTRKLVVMRYIDDLSPKEIGEILDETENVISVRLHRAIRKIRGSLPVEHNAFEKEKTNYI